MIGEYSFQDRFLYRSLKEMSGYAMPNQDADSVKIEYNLNSYGYRCDEFKDQEILTLGCSQTEGHGLPIDLTWPYLISKKMNKNYINLAKGGEGAQSQVVKAFKFFEEFYHPKYIFAAFPMARIDVPLIGLTTRNSNRSPMDPRLKTRFPEDNKNEGKIKIGKAILNNGLLEKYSKAPYKIESVLPEEFAFFYNILFIKILIQYCEANDIKLIWTDCKDIKLNTSSLKEFHNGYFESPYQNQPIEKKCHSEFADNPFFHYAADYDYWPPGHWNFHTQISSSVL